MGKVDIGFVESCEPWEVESRFFPSKIGGKPAWLDLKNLPEFSQIACDYCKSPCIFLCQIYAPYTEEEAFHRTLFIFICRDQNCCKANQSGNLKVFRSQLQRINEYYPPTPPEENENWRNDIQIEKWRKTCQVCGIVANSHCAKCKKTNYCCRAHQIIDWKSVHKKYCGSDEKITSTDIVFPQFELVMEEEEENNDGDDNDDDNDSEKEENETVSNSEETCLKKSIHDKLVGSLQNTDDVDLDLMRFANNKEDTLFLKFKNRIQSNPDQVIRYERGGSPLYISSLNHAQNIPKCEECKGDRQFEFQIMPQMLHHLKCEDSSTSLDWGILAIFTCKRSCTPKAGYASEYILKQDITEC